MAHINAGNYNVLIDEDIAILRSYIEQIKATKIFVIVDNNTKKHCLPYLEENLKLNFSSIQIQAGEEFKNLKTCSQVWNALIQNGCDRQSLILNLGGGVIGDMGGFIAASYMRGIPFIQMPSTLLAQVDASVGGKLGIDFLFHKNLIGLFQDPKLVWIQTDFLNTLNLKEQKNGFAEIIKHALISSRSQWDILKDKGLTLDSYDLKELILNSVEIKNKVVQEDPFESGKRKLLNFGHSIGHAIESYYLNSDKKISHGEAVAIGMICESHISYQKSMLPETELKEIAHFIHSNFSDTFELTNIKEDLFSLIKKDKKNLQQKILISTLTNISEAVYDLECSEQEIFRSFEYYENLY